MPHLQTVSRFTVLLHQHTSNLTVARRSKFSCSVIFLLCLTLQLPFFLTTTRALSGKKFGLIYEVKNVAKQWSCLILKDFKTDKACTTLKHVNCEGVQRTCNSECSVSCRSGDPVDQHTIWSPSWKANSSPADKEIPNTLWNRNVILCSQQPTTSPCPELGQSSPWPLYDPF
jgi:hypothetical protein